MFLEDCLTAPLVGYRTYSRRTPNGRESWSDICQRTLNGLIKTGKLTDSQIELIDRMQRDFKVLTSGRWLWIGGTEWLDDPINVYGAYNCSHTTIRSLHDIAMQMELTMVGCGIGKGLERKDIKYLPSVKHEIALTVSPLSTLYNAGKRLNDTGISVKRSKNTVTVIVGDSRQGWVNAYHELLKIATGAYDLKDDKPVTVSIDLSYIRPHGTPIKGFGGVANADSLPRMFYQVAKVLNRATGRAMTSEEVCLIIDEALVCVVSGNVRRSASIALFDADAPLLKENLWKQDPETGKWSIDPDRDALRMGNHTRVYHSKPSKAQCIDAVRSQYFSGEGAIEWAGEAVARANADLLNDEFKKQEFIELYGQDTNAAKYYLSRLDPSLDAKELDHRMIRYGLNPCFAAGTMVHTKNGDFPIEDLVGKSVEIFDGSEWHLINNFRVTGENQPVYKVTLHSGMEIVATEYHKFILADGTRKELKDLVIGDNLLKSSVHQESGKSVKGAYLKGFLTGDGTHNNTQTVLKIYPPKMVCVDRLISSQEEIEALDYAVLKNAQKGSSFEYGLTEKCCLKKLNQMTENLVDWVTRNRWEFPVDVFSWDLQSKYEYIAGIMDADGCATDSVNGFSYQITSIHEAWLKGFQILLASIGVKSKLNPVRKGGFKDFKEKGGIYTVQDCYRLTISQVGAISLSSLVRLSRLKSFADRTVSYNLKNKSYVVKSIEFSHVADKVYCCTVPVSHSFQLANGLIVGQCGEILMTSNFCNLGEVHLNMLDPHDLGQQEDAFRAAGYAVSTLLHHKFPNENYQYSRDIDPIVGVSFTGLFDFFVKRFGTQWLKWWEAGRPTQWGEITDMWGESFDLDGFNYLSDFFTHSEREYLIFWRNTATAAVYEYCDANGLRRPNRCTTCQPAGSKSLLTGASAGWHPPISARYIRRITFRKDDPVALAAIDYGYSVIPSQSCKDENGNLLDDPFDPRVTEWLVEVPIETSWANIDGASDVDISKFSALAQFDFYMNVQRYYTQHNSSSTISFRESEIEALGERIYQAIQNNEGYVSAALLARFDNLETFPRLPFEPIDKTKYDQLYREMMARRKVSSFGDALAKHDNAMNDEEKALDIMSSGAAPCDSDKCLLPLKTPN